MYTHKNNVKCKNNCVDKKKKACKHPYVNI